MLLALRHLIGNWLFQWRGAEPGTITLVQRRIFILPSRHGLLYFGALLLMLIGSVNYNLNLGFVLTFLLTAVGVNSILYTYRNLARLRISPGRAQPVFAGEQAQFPLVIDCPGTLDRYSIGVTRDKKNALYTDAPAGQATTVVVTVPAPRRGILHPGRLTFFSQYPIGLCHAWAYVHPDMSCLVYPRPESTRVDLPLPDAHNGQGISHGRGHEDFAGFRSYHPGDSPRHIAWKAAARGQSLLTKQFSGQADTELWLDWIATPDTLGIEDRLSRLARWVCDAHDAGMSFGLRLPGVTLQPAPGGTQRERCLEALALFQSGDHGNAGASR